MPHSPSPLIRREMPELDALRGVAILLVTVYHFFSQLAPDRLHGAWHVLFAASRIGWVGVPLFFILSGFLITGILLEQKTRGAYFRRFYVRRALRILPPLIVACAVWAATGILQGPDLALNLSFLANFAPAFHRGITPFWSLSVEEHFYLFWPAVVLTVKERTLFYVSGLVVLLALAARAGTWLAHHGYHDGIQFYTWCVMDGLALGALVALLARRYNHAPAAFGRLGAGLLGGVAVLSIVLWRAGLLQRVSLTGCTLQHTLMCLAFAALVMLCLTYGSRGGSLPGAALLAFFGYISYGLYLYHWPLYLAGDGLVRALLPHVRLEMYTTAALAMRCVVSGGGAVLLAWLSRRYLEDPLLRLKGTLAP